MQIENARRPVEGLRRKIPMPPQKGGRDHSLSFRAVCLHPFTAM